VYNDARHVLFALPPLIVLCAVTFESILRTGASKLAKVTFAVVLACTMVEPLYFMVRNHPNQGVYFSPLIGGVNGAWQRYETDFWGNSTRQAVEWIQTNTEPEGDSPVRIRIWYGDQTKAAYYVHKQPGYEHTIAGQESSGWDYWVIQTVEAKFRPGLLSDWPPPGTVYEVLAGSTPLCAVVINHRNREPEAVLGAMRTWAAQRRTHAHYASLGSMSYLLGSYRESLDAYGKAAELKPDDAPTWHALGAAHGRLESWDEQIAACKQALGIDPELEGARHNLIFALRKRNDSAAGASQAPLSHDEYLSRNIELYEEGRYEEAVETCRLALREDPASALAYNNLCAAHNALEEWEKAREACEMALVLQPDFPRARNNLAQAMAGNRP
jgi:Flp pilus assembly protein TadD